MPQNQDIGETLHTEVDLKPTLNERALKAIGRPLTQEETDRLYAKILKPSDDIKGPFVCLVCAYSALLSKQLREHVRIHTGEKPFQCNFCPKKFTQKAYCDQHIRTHTGEKPFQCTLCPKRFTQKGDCNKHIRTHTGEKPLYILS